MSTTQSWPRTAERLLLIVLLLAAFWVRLHDLNAPSIWHDEGWSIRAIRDPIGTPDDKTPLAYYSLIHVLWLGAGETPLALRYGSVLLDVVTLALVARVMRRWYGTQAALLAAVFFAASPLLWAYAREIRAYVAVPLLTVLLLWLAERILRQATTSRPVVWRLWFVTLIAEVVLLYTHNLAVPVIAWLNLVIGVTWAWSGRWPLLIRWGGVQAVGLVLYLPWLLGQAPSGTPLNSPPAPSLTLVWDIWQGYFAPRLPQLGDDTALVLASGAFGVVALGAAVAAIIWRDGLRTRLLFSQAVLLPVFSTVILHAARIDFHPRYYILAVPATLMLVAAGLDALPPARGLHQFAAPVALALASSTAIASFPPLFTEPTYQHDDFRALARYYAQLPADAAIVIPYGWEPALEEYYVEKLGVEAAMVGIDLHSSASEVVATLNTLVDGRETPLHVELLTWYQLPADVRGMYPCLLESAGERLDDATLTVQGLTTQAYRLDGPLVSAPLPDVAADFGLMRLQGAVLHGPAGVCLQTDWTLSRPTDQDWRVSGALLAMDPPGWTVARDDSDIRADDQQPTSGWDVGAPGQGFSLLRVPPGAPPGDYETEVRVYSRAQQSGLDRLVDGVPAGKAASLGTVVRPAVAVDAPDRLAARRPLAVLPDDAGPVRLLAHDARAADLNPGQELRITLHWSAPGECDPGSDCTPLEPGELVLRGEDWALAQPVQAYPGYSQDWHVMVIPGGVSGDAVLQIVGPDSEPVELAVYTIEETDYRFAPPAFEVPVGVEFSGIAVLDGVSVTPRSVPTGDPLDLTLVWRALGPSNASYRVFTHLLNAEGRVIAQHDGYPVDETRLTTGWVADEYLVDQHTLTFLPEGAGYTGPARLEVGLYNPDTNVRVPLSNGADHVVLPVEIVVE